MDSWGNLWFDGGAWWNSYFLWLWTSPPNDKVSMLIEGGVGVSQTNLPKVSKHYLQSATTPLPYSCCRFSFVGWLFKWKSLFIKYGNWLVLEQLSWTRAPLVWNNLIKQTPPSGISCLISRAELQLIIGLDNWSKHRIQMRLMLWQQGIRAPPLFLLHVFH